MKTTSAKKNIWLLTVGEPLPTDGKNQRLLRTGILAELMSQQGHEVTWWTSSFDHSLKRQRNDEDQKTRVGDRYDLYCLFAEGYSRNVSLARVRNHQTVARKFRELASLENKPDVILCSWPLVELAAEAVRYGKANGIPVVLDFRDMWPDAIVDLFPPFLRPAIRIALRNHYREAQYAVSEATAISGITDKIVDWGLGISGRERSSLDVAFPMGYRKSAVQDEDIQEAKKYWNSLDVGRTVSEFVVCFFGCIGRHFEWETVFQAARKLEDSGRKFKFVLCGQGPHLAKWQKVSSQYPNVLLPGWVDAAKIRSLMEYSKVGLAPYVSSWDFTMSLPNKPIEYLSSGLPVVSSLQGELASLLSKNDCGVTYENRSVDDLVRTLTHCYDRPQFCAEMAKNSEKLYQKKFVAERVYGQMSAFLVQLAEQEIRQIAA